MRPRCMPAAACRATHRINLVACKRDALKYITGLGVIDCGTIPLQTHSVSVYSSLRGEPVPLFIHINSIHL